MPDTPIILDDDNRGLNYNDRIPISLTAPRTCSREISVGSVEANSEDQKPPLAVLVEDGGGTSTEEWLVDEILKLIVVEEGDQEMRWYFVKWRGYDPSWQPERDLIPG
ncbi:hypothetical protein GX48_02340 [Paracoccidioides brasiliensis]|nr:hypothetical protein GX48_02340 [Paracoccidioides brasiliensis]